MIRKDEKTPICPECYSENLIGIAYGHPGKGMHETSRRGEVKLGGCIIRSFNPDCYCKTCNHSWYDPDDSRRIKRLAKLDQILSRVRSDKKRGHDGG